MVTLMVLVVTMTRHITHHPNTTLISVFTCIVITRQAGVTLTLTSVSAISLRVGGCHGGTRSPLIKEMVCRITVIQSSFHPLPLCR